MGLFKRRKGKTVEEWRELGLNAKDPEEAVEYYTKCLELNPKDAEVWDSKGATLYALKRYEEAISCYGKALEINPKHAWAWYGRGLTLYDLRRYEEAIKCFDKVLKINPKDVVIMLSAWNMKGDALCNLERYEEATNCYDISLENAPNSEGTKLRKYKTKVEQWKREGYKVDDLEEMFK